MRGPIIAVVLAAGLWTLAVRAQTPAPSQRDGQRFQEAVTLMDVRREYLAAVRLFEQVAAGPDRRLAARALVYIGICYERLGRREARTAYERVLAEFGDQGAAVRDARARLAALERVPTPPPQPAPTITLRQAWPERPPNTMGFGDASANGRWLVVVQGGEDRPSALLETSTGRLLDRPFLLNPATAEGVRPCSGAYPGVPSPDGRFLAFSCDVADKRQELRVMARDGPWQVLFRSDPEHVVSARHWGASGTLVATVKGPEGHSRVLLLSVRTGATREAFAVAVNPATLTVSPDERWLVFANPSTSGDDDDLFIARLPDGAPRVLVGGPPNDMHPVWSGDGRHLLFVSDRTGTSALWIVPVADGEVLEAPRVVQQDIGRVVKPLGLTTGGEYLYFRQLGFPEAYAVPIAADGLPVGAPTVLSREYAGSNMFPTWSPDGTRAAFVAQIGFRSRLVIGIRDMGAETQRSLQTGMTFIGPIRWSPDGGLLLAYGRHSDGRWGLFSIDVKSGDTRAVLAVAPSDESFLGNAAWSRDGASIYYVWAADGAQVQVRHRSLATGTENVVFTGPAEYWPSGDTHLDVSERTGALAVVLFHEGGSAVMVRSAGGATAPVFTTSGTERASGVGWLPDGRHLVISRFRIDDATRQWGLWRLDTETGSAVDLGIRMHSLRDIQVSRDGRFVAFTSGYPSRDVWVLANFLPPSALAPALGRRDVQRR